MKKIISAIFAVALLFSLQPLYAQYNTQAEVVSAGGRAMSGGIYTNFAVIGEPIVKDTCTFNDTLTQIGFIYRAVDTLPVLLVNPDTIYVQQTAGTCTFDILNVGSETKTMDWQVSAVDAWLTVAPVTGTDNATITVNYGANGQPLALARQGMLIVTAPGAVNSPDTVHIMQAGSLEYQALKALYDSTNGDNWTDNTNWLAPGQPVNTWYGITIQGQKINIDLSANNLVGIIPPQIGNLDKLVTLDISSNQLTDNIPASLGNLSSLEYLNLQENQLSGSVPDEIAALGKLKEMYLSSNDLENLSTLPGKNPLKKLETLEIDNNKFTFEDIVPYVEGLKKIDYFLYTPQDSIDSPINTTVASGSSYTMNVSDVEANNQYQWYKNGVTIPGATAGSYTISPVSSADTGTYTCDITNTVATGLTLHRRPVIISILESLSKTTTKPGAFTNKAEPILKQNYPNPFNGKTQIEYYLPDEQHVKIEIYNLLGNKVATLVNKTEKAGYHQVMFNGKNSGEGLYVYRMITGDFVISKQMQIIR